MLIKRAVTRGVWGHAPPGNFLNFRWILLLFGTFFYHGNCSKLYNKNQQLQRINSCCAKTFLGAFPGGACPQEIF